MMKVLYYIFIQLFRVLSYLVSFFHQKAHLFVAGREKVFSRLERLDKSKKLVWFHCSSLGEFEQGRPLMEQIRKDNPSWQILLTFFSPSGYEIRKDYEGADLVSYLPVDTPVNARKFLDRVQPDLVYFIKYEYWYFILKEMHRRKIPAYLVSAIFRKDQIFFRWYGGFFRKILHFFRLIFVQNEESEQRLKEIGVDHVIYAGDTRFDRVTKIVENAEEMPLVEAFKGEELTLVAGSTWPKDEELLLSYYLQHNQCKMIIAPHEVHESHISQIERLAGDKKCLRYSATDEFNVKQADLLIVDSIGRLSSLYKYGDLAYVGGGFGKGIHNILEAATYGVPVVFGPNHQKFSEAIQLLKEGGAYAISDQQNLNQVFHNLLHHNENRKNAGKKAQQFVEKNTGATHKVLNNTVL